MRALLTASAVLALSACGQPPADSVTPQPAPPAASATSPATPRAAVEGWETDVAAYPLIGATTPDFSGVRANGDALTRDSLRGRWTILGFGAFDTSTPDETTFIMALNSAVDQDPDLDFLQVFRLPPDVTAPRVSPWPSVSDDGKIIEAFSVATTPAYLLIGPDLTIEGYRGALSVSPDDGIKPVIRGVADIRKQISAPQ